MHMPVLVFADPYFGVQGKTEDGCDSQGSFKANFDIFTTGELGGFPEKVPSLSQTIVVKEIFLQKASTDIFLGDNITSVGVRSKQM